MEDCVFCTIASGAFGTEFLYEDDRVVAFDDLHPQAPIHVLVVPKRHFDTIADGVPAEVLASMVAAAKAVAEKTGIASTGFRCIMNTGSDAGQTVQHLHMHILGGASLGEGLLARN